MEPQSRLWKLNDIDQWELFNHVEEPEVKPTTSLAPTSKKEASATTEKTNTKTQKPSAQLFYISKTKQEVKGSVIYTPKGYGIIQNIMPDKNMVTVKVNNEIIDYDRGKVSNEILIEFIHAQMGGKRTERISFPIQTTAKEIAERITSQYEDATLMSRLFFKGNELPLSNDNLEKLGINHTSKILVMTKLGKFFSVNRFKQMLSGWNLGSHCFEGISFSTSKDIRVAGIGLYGPNHQNCAFVGTAKITRGQSADDEAVSSVEVELKFTSDPTDKIQKVMFDKPVSVRQSEILSIVAELSIQADGSNPFSFGGSSHYGNMGQPTVLGDGDVTFTFLACSGLSKANQTNIYSGQIPEIYYYT